MEIPREDADELGAALSPRSHRMAWSISRWTRKARCSSIASTASSCGGSGGAKDAIRCAPTSPRTIPRCCGKTIPSSCVEEAFKEFKGDLAIRPVFHQEERRIKVYIFIAFLAYFLQITLQRRRMRRRQN